MEITFKKERDDNRWYVVLLDYQGLKQDLEMVCGADNMLDIISDGTYIVNVNIVDKNAVYDLHLERKCIGEGSYENFGGAVYDYHYKNTEGEMWLCDVMLYVFGEFPENIYIKVI